MTLTNHYRSDRTGLSFELFPPKTEKGETQLYSQLKKLMEFSPDYVTCTYGAGGSEQDKTLDIISKVKNDFDVPVASHLTVVGSTVDQLRIYLQKACDRNVDYIVALRGDPPQGETEFQSHAGGLSYANELVELIQSEFNQLGIAVAGYPEKHREAVSMDIDLDNLKRKVDAGADIIITQLFYDNQDFFRFQDLCADRQINVPIVPGILPVVSLKQIQRIAKLCDSKLPSGLTSQLDAANSDEAQLDVGIEFATQQVDELKTHGVCGLHFYVLNKSKSTAKVLEAINFCGT